MLSSVDFDAFNYTFDDLIHGQGIQSVAIERFNPIIESIQKMILLEI